MTFVVDLQPLDYFGRWQDVLVAVGWLERGREYTKGEVSEDFFTALVRTLIDPWQPMVVAGPARCAFCKFSRGPSQLVFKGTAITLGTQNVCIPNQHRVFVAPSLVAHYIDAHEYCPPQPFQEAVIRCPPMKSVGYLRRLTEIGLRLSS